MIILDVFYVAIATIVVIAVLQLITFAAVRIMYPPEPKVVYREVQVPVQAPPQQPMGLPFSIGAPPTATMPNLPTTQPPPMEQKPAFTQQTQEVQLPDYEPRSTPSSTSLRLDAGLPDGLQETRPPGI
jgi:cell envelope opacity-associated protein A